MAFAAGATGRAGASAGVSARLVAATGSDWHAVDSIGVEQLAGSITGWQQVYDQISPGRFQGALTELLLGPAQLFVESSSHALVQICKTWPQAVWFGIPAHDDHVGRIEGIRIERGMLAVRTGRSDFQLTTPDNFSFLGVVVDVSALQAHGEFGGADLPDRLADERVLKVPEADLNAFRQWLRCVLHAGSVGHTNELAPAARAQIVDDALSRLVPLLMRRSRPATERVSCRHARRIVARTREYLMANDDRAVTVQELCAQLGTSRRAVQDCFQRSIDLSPKAYLRAFALNAARRELQRRDSPLRTVGDVAGRYGFWHFSQFATDYRRLFHELPSQTLRQRGESDPRSP